MIICKLTKLFTSLILHVMWVIEQTVNTWVSDIRTRQKASRNTVILRLSRLGCPQEKIVEVVGLSRNRASEIVGNANFGDIDTLLAQGHDMEYIARHYNMDLRQCRWRAGWALRLEGKTDQEKLKELAFCPDLIFSRNQGKPAKIGLARFAS